MRPVDALIEHLEAQQARGKTHVLLDDEAREGLRALFIQARDAAKSGTPQPSPAKPQAQPKPEPAIKVEATATPQAAPAEMPILKATGDTRQERLDGNLDMPVVRRGNRHHIDVLPFK